MPVSALVHVVVILLLVTPVFGPTRTRPVPLGAGGLGAVGGGGGGVRGPARGSAPLERIHFTRVVAAREPIARAAKPNESITPPVPARTPVTRPKPVVQPVARPAPVAPRVDVQVDAPKLPEQVALAPVPGAGTGRDGTSGGGPGTGGGVGTGVGTGRGSSEGPGTGGGTGAIYPATPEFLVMPALPVPKRVQGRTIELRFTIDERGRIVSVDFDSSGDPQYDRQLRERLLEYRFRPAHRMDGTPVPSVYVTQLTL